jgi:hypothetical protein
MVAGRGSTSICHELEHLVVLGASSILLGDSSTLLVIVFEALLDSSVKHLERRRVVCQLIARGRR